MDSAVIRGAVAVLLVVSAACDGSPTAPQGVRTDQSQVARVPPQPVTTPPNFPPLSGLSHTFRFSQELAPRVSSYTKESRFILYDNGAFVLQYAGGAYLGRYSVSNGAVTFVWRDSTAASHWSATGTLNGDSLTVQYNDRMQLDDFEDAVYALSS
jgi:hypothetical protein